MQQDPSASAKWLVDLWQEHFRQMVHDERYLNATLDMLRQMQSSLKPAAPSPSSASPAPFHDSPAPDTPAASAAASDAEPGKLALLTQRIGLCEQRIAELEQQLLQRPK